MSVCWAAWNFRTDFVQMRVPMTHIIKSFCPTTTPTRWKLVLSDKLRQKRSILTTCQPSEESWGWTKHLWAYQTSEMVLMTAYNSMFVTYRLRPPFSWRYSTLHWVQISRELLEIFPTCNMQKLLVFNWRAWGGEASQRSLVWSIPLKFFLISSKQLRSASSVAPIFQCATIIEIKFFGIEREVL